MPDHIRRWRETGDKEHLFNFYRREEYGRIYAKPRRKWSRKLQLLAELMQIGPDETVLDVGCASKILKQFVEERGGSYKGLDIAGGFDPDYLCDAEDMSLIGDDEFDWVVLADVLEHLPHPELAIREAFRVGRKVIAVLPNWYRLERIRFLPRDPGDRHITRKHPSGWIDDFRSAGFCITHLRGFHYAPSVAFIPVLPLRAVDHFFRLKPFDRISACVDERFADKRLIRFLGQEIIVVAGKHDRES
ncbi:class I SAM-dependent methyltransferase [Candidatus Bipolaricaulota bacterium]